MYCFFSSIFMNRYSYFIYLNCQIASDSVWQNVSLQWCQVLDAVRYLVVWNPIIFLAMHIVIHLFGWHNHD